tara:strand:- start:401 stop:796 length:396 start_codon:yes stop_codon:yes gene_type:complete
MKKRGEAAWWFLIELIGAIFIVYLAVDFATSISEGTIFEKRNIARDISMQINTLSGLPGNGYIVNKNLHGYSLHFYNDRVEVFEEPSDALKGVHPFVAIKDSDWNLPFDKPTQIVVVKTGEDMMIQQNIPS